MNVHLNALASKSVIKAPPETKKRRIFMREMMNFLREKKVFSRAHAFASVVLHSLVVFQTRVVFRLNFLRKNLSKVA